MTATLTKNEIVVLDLLYRTTDQWSRQSMRELFRLTQTEDDADAAVQTLIHRGLISEAPNAALSLTEEGKDMITMIRQDRDLPLLDSDGLFPSID